LLGSTTEDPALPAGAFSAWLAAALRSLRGGGGVEVPCGDCVACCSSSYFIHIRPEEAATLRRVDPQMLAAAPGLPPGHVLLGYDRAGRCPMLRDTGCHIYADRPRTCRVFDCRVFAAAGSAAGGPDKDAISRQARRWRFDYPSQRDRDEHRAVQAAAWFLRERAAYFPGGRAPRNPSQIATSALEAHALFLGRSESELKAAKAEASRALAAAFVETCRAFERG